MTPPNPPQVAQLPALMRANVWSLVAELAACGGADAEPLAERLQRVVRGPAPVRLWRDMQLRTRAAHAQHTHALALSKMRQCVRDTHMHFPCGPTCDICMRTRARHVSECRYGAALREAKSVGDLDAPALVAPDGRTSIVPVGLRLLLAELPARQGAHAGGGGGARARVACGGPVGMCASSAPARRLQHGRRGGAVRAARALRRPRRRPLRR